MIQYNMREVKTAIFQLVEVGTQINVKELENLKWFLILNDGFKCRGWLKIEVLGFALHILNKEGYLEKYRDPKTNERFYIRVK